MRPLAVTLTSLFAAMTLIATAPAAERNPVRTRPAPDSQPAQRIIVKFRQSLSIQATKGGESTTQQAGVVDVARMNALASRARVALRASRGLGDNMYAMQVSPATSGETVAETLARLRADSDVEAAEIDRPVYLHATDPNDTRYLLNTAADAGQWYLRAAQPSAINASGAWDITKGSNGVVIAVVDTGVRYDHEDLQPAAIGGKLLPGFDFIQDATTAGDGDGYDSDPTDAGDFCTAQADGSSWHGTRVSGIIGARTNNNLGIAGINWNGYILPVRVIGRCGGRNSDVIAGIRWAAGLSVPGAPINPYPAQVINISLGGTGACDSLSAAAVSAAAAAGALVVVSAGNEGGPVDSPANCPGAMAVLGLRHAGTKVGFSSLGPEIAIGAPGGNCVNTTAGQPCVYSIDTTTNLGASLPGANSYTDKVGNTNLGTSFSSPIVSGIAGLMLSVNGNLKSKQLIARMREGASPYPQTSDSTNPVPVACQNPASVQTLQNTECICNTAVCGAGMANAFGAVNAALRPIAAVTFPSSYAAGGSVTLNGSGSGGACNRTISSYSWTAGGAEISNTSSVTLTAPASGTTSVRLTVTDDAGKTDFADITVGATSASSTAPTVAGSRACLTDITPPASVTITATDANAAEAGADPGVFTITRTGSTSKDLTVNVALSGTATSGSDYSALPTAVTIPADKSSITLTVTPIDDTIVEAAETVVATVQSGSAYQVGDPASATVTIADNDTTPAPSANSTGGGGGGGGGGALDPLTLLGAFCLAVLAALRRRATQVLAASPRKAAEKSVAAASAI